MNALQINEYNFYLRLDMNSDDLHHVKVADWSPE